MNATTSTKFLWLAAMGRDGVATLAGFSDLDDVLLAFGRLEMDDDCIRRALVRGRKTKAAAASVIKSVWPAAKSITFATYGDAA